MLRSSPAALLITAIVLLGCCAEAQATPKVHGIFSSNMVIQRDKPITVWGWADPGVTLSVTLGDEKVTAQAKDGDGAWSVSFDARPASTDPVTLTVTDGKDTVRYDNIVFGDVWVMVGQSNMAWPMEKTVDADLQKTQANLPLLRLCKLSNNEQKELQRDIPTEKLAFGGWVVSTPETAAEVSAIGFAFGSVVQRATSVPIGILDVARGGASIEALVPERMLDKDPLTKRYAEHVKKREAEFSADDWLADQIKKWEGKVEGERKKGTPEKKLTPKPTAADIKSWNIPGMSPSDSGACYNGMFGACIGANIKGVLFHQGFNNTLGDNCRPKRYRTIMRLMVEGWREDFTDPKLPVGIIEFCAGGNPQTSFNFESHSQVNGAFIREAQRLGLADVGDPEFTAFLPGHDVQIPGLHPRKKAEHGVRAARWALSRVYGMDVAWETAKLVSSEVVGDEIVLTFDKPVFPHNHSAYPEGFGIAGEDGQFFRAFARFRTTTPQPIPSGITKEMDTKVIHVWSPLVEKPVGVRYAWATSPLGNLYVDGNAWAPLPSFRTDTFDLPESEDPAVNGLPGVNYREVNKQLDARNAMRLEKEAEMAVQINERLKTLGLAPKP